MDKPGNNIAAAISMLLASYTTIATASLSLDTEGNYLDSNWILTNPGNQPHQRATRVFENISSGYFDANWSLINSGGQTVEQPTGEIDNQGKP